MLAEVLTRARDLIAEGWCQGTFARKADGSSCSVLDPEAVFFCAWGALSRAKADLKVTCPEAMDVLSAIASSSLSYYNDTHRKGEVLALFDKGIANASKS